MKKTNDKRKNIFIWILVMFLSIAILIMGHKSMMINGNSLFLENPEVHKAKVVEIMEKGSIINELFSKNGTDDYNIQFKCEILDKEEKGKIIIANQTISSNYKGADLEKHVETGDLILINQINTATDEWSFSGYYRFDKMILLAMAFAIITIFVGKWKGINALIALIFTSIFVFAIFIPWILSGYNTYIGVAITCIFTIIMSLLLIEGCTTKTLVTVLSCCIGTGIAALIPILMNKMLHLTGLIDEHSTYLLLMNSKINLLEILYSGIIIGSLGAIMDVSMDIASSLYEIKTHVPDITFKKLCKSGMEISRDIIGTMTNTLVLAYIGGSLPSILLLITYSSSLMQLLNMELIISEILQTFAGSIALVFTAPITAIVAGYIYSKIKKTNREKGSQSVEYNETA